MAYLSPSITPSGATFAQLRAGGFQGQLTRLADANALPPAIRSLVVGPLDRVKVGITHVLDAFLQGDPISTGDVNAKLLAFAMALKVIATALEEANVLVDANPGTLSTVASAGAAGQRKRRTFP